MTRDFKSNDLGISASNLRKDRENGNDILDRVNINKIIEDLKNKLDIKNKDEQIMPINDEHRIQIKEYLELLDLTTDIEVRSLPVCSNKEYRTIFSQPGMRYSIAKALIDSLLLDEQFQDLEAEARKYICECILNEIKGRMIDDLVLLETKQRLKNKEVFKLLFPVGEFDMVIYDQDDVSCLIYEIKYSDKVTEGQYKNLIDNEKCAKTEFRYGRIKGKCVLYRGPSVVLDNGLSI